ncbi:MAG: hypothetical protein Q7R51_00975 [bacterium]|nr:hypothetical protein [bacterium]
MSAERQVEGKSPQQSTGHQSVDGLIVSQAVKDLPRFIQSIPFVFPDEFIATYAMKISDKTKGFLPIIVSSHTSHLDGLPLSVVAKILTDMTNLISGEHRLKGFTVPIAASMETGNQGSIVKKATEHIKKIMAQQYNLQTMPYVRAKDEKQYDIPRDRHKFLRDLTEQVRNGYGLALFPEATMQGGRTKRRIFGRTERFGMQEFKYMEAIAAIAKRTGKEPLYIPIGIDGGFRLESPDNNRPTLAYLREIFLTQPAQTKLVNARVGLPITQKEIGSADINDFLGKTVAGLLPEKARGVYA